MKILGLLLTLFALPAFAAGSALVTWVAPTTNTDGSALTDLAGYNIYRGTNASTLAKVGNTASQSFTDSNLAPGTYYYAVTAYNAAKVESAYSVVVNKVIAAPKPAAPTGVVIK